MLFVDTSILLFNISEIAFDNASIVVSDISLGLCTEPLGNLILYSSRSLIKNGFFFFLLNFY